MCIIQQDSNDLLNVAAPRGIKHSSGIGVWGKLDAGAVVWWMPGMWGMFQALWVWVLGLLEGMLNVPGHGQIHCVQGIIPGDGQATVPASLPIFCYLIVFFKAMSR